MSKKVEYISQFDFGDMPEPQPQGVLLEVKSNDVSDEKLYNKWRNLENDKSLAPFLWGVAMIPFRRYGFSALFILMSIISFIVAVYEIYFLISGVISLFLAFVSIYIKKKLRHRAFLKYNNKEVILVNGGVWECPSCFTENNRLQHCRTCGVLPIFKKYEQK